MMAHTYVLVLRRLRQEDLKFKGSLNNSLEALC